MSFVLFMALVSCATNRSMNSLTPSGPRTIVLDGDTIPERFVGGFTSWKCKDYSNGGPIRVEVGFFGDPKWEGVGFILYDGGYSGKITHYQRMGLEHRWDWGPNEADYSVVIKTDGTGAYYNFSTVSKGESTKPREIYKCKQR